MAEEMSTTTPDRVQRPGSHKIAVGSTGGAITILFVWVLHQFVGIDMPAEAAQALTMVVGTGLSLMVPDDMEAP